MEAIRSERVIAGVPGVQFHTNAVPDTPEEELLQEIQKVLANGKVLLGWNETIAQLFHVYEQVLDGWPRSTIGLWVPASKSRDAESLLARAGFTVIARPAATSG
jgi:hypothetical protein